MAAMAGHPWPLALSAHIHLREVLRYGSTATPRFEQAAAIVPTPGAVPAISGVTPYIVQARASISQPCDWCGLGEP